MLQVVTPAGGRHEAWALSQRYMAEQTYPGPVRWIVIDDGPEPLRADFRREGVTLEIHRAPPMVGNSQARNMAMALDLADSSSPVACWEDDDAYLPGHLNSVLAALAQAELVGERVARYYNVATRRFRELPGHFHASLASTAARGRALALLREVCAAGSRRIDMDLWQAFKGPRALLETANVVGIKGMPGRGGIGVGHRDTFGDPDPSGQVLAQWLGPAAEAYRGFRRVHG